MVVGSASANRRVVLRVEASAGGIASHATGHVRGVVGKVKLLVLRLANSSACVSSSSQTVMARGTPSSSIDRLPVDRMRDVIVAPCFTTISETERPRLGRSGTNAGAYCRAGHRASACTSVVPASPGVGGVECASSGADSIVASTWAASCTDKTWIGGICGVTAVASARATMPGGTEGGLLCVVAESCGIGVVYRLSACGHGFSLWVDGS
jgi:hypothetical protein